MSSLSNLNSYRRTMNGIQSFDDGMGGTMEDGNITCNSFSTDTFNATNANITNVNTSSLKFNGLVEHNVSKNQFNQISYYQTIKPPITQFIFNIDNFDVLKLFKNKVQTNVLLEVPQFDATQAYINTLNAATIDATNIYGKLHSTLSDITTLNTSTINASSVNSTYGAITTLNVSTINASNINSTNGSITTLNTSTINASNVNSTNGSITTINSSTINASDVNFTNGTITILNTSTINASNVNSTDGTITTLNSTNVFCSSTLKLKSLNVPIIEYFPISWTQNGNLGYTTWLITLSKTINYSGDGFMINGYNSNYPSKPLFQVLGVTPSLNNTQPAGSFNRVHLFYYTSYPSSLHEVLISVTYVPV